MRHWLFILFMGLGLAVAGCESTQTVEADEAEETITADDVLHDMSPRLDHLTRTHDEARITHARTLDTNGRGFWNDVEKFFLLDRPIRMQAQPIPIP